MGDILASRLELGRERLYSMEIVRKLNNAKIRDYQARFRNYVRQAKVPFSDFDEYWLITDEFSEETINTRVDSDRHFRVIELGELEKLFLPRSSQSRPRAKIKARTRIGKAIENNETEIRLAIAGLILQLDDKLEALRQERPNSEEAIASRDLRISEYDRMRSELQHVQEMMARFKSREVKETKVVKSVTTFADCVRDW